MKAEVTVFQRETGRGMGWQEDDWNKQKQTERDTRELLGLGLSLPVLQATWGTTFFQMSHLKTQIQIQKQLICPVSVYFSSWFMDRCICFRKGKIVEWKFFLCWSKYVRHPKHFVDSQFTGLLIYSKYCNEVNERWIVGCIIFQPCFAADLA